MISCPYCNERVTFLGRGSVPVTVNISTVMASLGKCSTIHDSLPTEDRARVPQGLKILLADGEQFFHAWHAHSHGKSSGPLPFRRYQGWLRASAALTRAYEELGATSAEQTWTGPPLYSQGSGCPWCAKAGVARYDGRIANPDTVFVRETTRIAVVVNALEELQVHAAEVQARGVRQGQLPYLEEWGYSLPYARMFGLWLEHWHALVHTRGPGDPEGDKSRTILGTIIPAAQEATHRNIDSMYAALDVYIKLSTAVIMDYAIAVSREVPEFAPWKAGDSVRFNFLLAADCLRPSAAELQLQSTLEATGFHRSAALLHGRIRLPDMIDPTTGMCPRDQVIEVIDWIIEAFPAGHPGREEATLAS